MNSLKHNSALLGLLFLYVSAVGGGGFWLVRTQRQAQRDLARLELKIRERDQVMRLSPAPSLANEEAIVAEVRAAALALETLRSSLQGRDAGALASPPPAQALESYFEFAGFVERTRALAERLRVRLKAHEHFGFTTYAGGASETVLLPVVHRQQIVVQQMVESLFEAGPHELLLVQRERPLSVAQRAVRPTPTPAGNGNDALADGAEDVATDFFVPDKRLTLQATGLVNTSAFRVEFTGQTRVLRTFLNSLAEFRLPLVVRSVEVEPLGASADPVRREPAPLVQAAPSKFSVVLECLEILPAATGAPL